MTTSATQTDNRLRQLENHLQQENPVLLESVKSFRMLDKVARRLGLLAKEESYATQIPWWPLISVLGTFSAGKSSFINSYLGCKLQRSGNQAVDDKFTVICFSPEESPRTLPGIALDSDPRFPFYQMSEEIESADEGEGERLDAYLQLKTCPSERLRGKILIDSPGFDADDQRTATLRITDRIIDLSDLVLVLFDARHPEPGAMQDTLKHLVSDTITRADAGKFMYILNQMDTTAQEDNPEDVVAAWQRALGDRGLTAGRFYTVYNAEAAVPIEDESLRQRFERKRDTDLSEIHDRMEQVEIERAYRIVGALEKTAKDIQEKAIPELRTLIGQWRKRTLIIDAVLYGALAAGFLGLSITQGWWQGSHFQPPWLDSLTSSPARLYATTTGLLALLLVVHFLARWIAAKSLRKQVAKAEKTLGIKGRISRAFQRNTRPWRSIFATRPLGAGPITRGRLAKVLTQTDQFVQTLNDKFTNPSGTRPASPARPAVEQPAATPEAAGETA